uniref:tetraspanin-18-like n=1 Tax=Myxine glutinosa TaxID=7769 RepID=UPI00358E1A44
MRYKGDNATDMLSSFWNTAMVVLDCCGARGPQDFGSGSLFSEKFPGQAVPVACCRKHEHHANAMTSHHQQCVQGLVDWVNSQGCFHQLVHTLRPYILIVGGVFISLQVLQVNHTVFIPIQLLQVVNPTQVIWSG